MPFTLTGSGWVEDAPATAAGELNESLGGSGWVFSPAVPSGELGESLGGSGWTVPSIVGPNAPLTSATPAGELGETLDGNGWTVPPIVSNKPTINLDFSLFAFSQAMSFTRATTATVTDHLGAVNAVKSGELRHQGLRRVENLIANSVGAGGGVGVLPTGWATAGTGNGISVTCVGVAGGFVDIRFSGTANALCFPSIGFTTALAVPAVPGQVATAGVTRELIAGSYPAGSATLQILWRSSGAANLLTVFGDIKTPAGVARKTVTTATAPASTAAVQALIGFAVANAETVDFTLRLSAPQLEFGSVMSEYVSTSAAASPAFHGAYVDGVRYFTTDAAGVAIAEATRQGVLLEESRTNLLLNATLDGANLATQGVTVAAVAHTLSFYGTGTVTLSGASTAGPLVGSGAFPTRSTLAFTPTAGTLTLTVTGTVQFAQLEAGAAASSFIPTAGAAVTRNADSLSLTLPGAFSATQGTWLADFAESASADRIVLEGAATTGLTIGSNAGATGPRIQDRAGTTRADFGATVAAGARVKAAVSYAAASTLASVNGATLTSGATPTQADYGSAMQIGSRDGTSMWHSQTIRAIRWYPRVLGQTELNALTA